LRVGGGQADRLRRRSCVWRLLMGGTLTVGVSGLVGLVSTLASAPVGVGGGGNAGWWGRGSREHTVGS
jgi:hypothetical protein